MQQKENNLLHPVLIFILLFAFILPAAQAQNYAVQVIPQLLPPYSLNLTDYYTGSREKLAVTLINRDLQKPMLQVRLRMSIESQNVIIRSRDNVYYPSIDLDPGIPLRLSLSDLAPYFNTNNLDFQGITRMQYQQGAKLPDGLYRFNFEAIELITGRVVSQKSYAMAWLSLSDPPLINLPRKGETIAFREPTNIIFNWTPRHMSSPNSAFNTQYEFSLVEIWDNGVAPESAFLSAQPLYQTTTNATTLLYGPGEPPLLPGKRYAWRVKAQAKDGADDYDLFRNQGYSEIYWFTQSADCKLPQNIKVSINGAIATLSWDADFNKNDYIVEYREKDKARAEWFSQKTTENRMPLYDLKPGKTYEYRVGGTCNGMDYVYADIQTLTTETPTGQGTVNCGLEAKFDITNKTPIQTLNPGETILAGDFPVKLTEVFPSSGATFNGKGYITIPFIGMLNIAVAFDRIKVNTDRQLIDGVIVTVNDVTESQVVSADNVVEQAAAIAALTNDVITKAFGSQEVIPETVNSDTTVLGNNEAKPIIKEDIPVNTTEPANTVASNQTNVPDPANSNPAVNTTAQPENMNTTPANNTADSNMPAAEESKKIAPFNVVGLTATDLSSSTRVAKAGETLYYVNRPGPTEKKNTKFELSYSPQLKANEIIADNMTWSVNGSKLPAYNGKSGFSQVVNESKDVNITSIAGYPDLKEQEVHVKWVDQDYFKTTISISSGNWSNPTIKKLFEATTMFDKATKVLDKIPFIKKVQNKNLLTGAGINYYYNIIPFQKVSTNEQDIKSRLYYRKDIMSGGFEMGIRGDVTVWKWRLPLKDIPLLPSWVSNAIVAEVSVVANAAASGEIKGEVEDHLNVGESEKKTIRTAVEPAIIKLDVSFGVKSEFSIAKSFDYLSGGLNASGSANAELIRIGYYNGQFAYNALYNGVSLEMKASGYINALGKKWETTPVYIKVQLINPEKQ